MTTHAGNVLVATAPLAAPTTVFFGLAVNTTYYLFARAFNDDQKPTAFVALGATSTLSNKPIGPPTTSFAQVDFGAIRYEWAPNGNPAGTSYRVQVSTSLDFTTLHRSSVTLATSTLFGAGGEGAALANSTTFYFRVRSENRQGLATAFTTIESTRTLPSDINPPTIDDRQGGDGFWRNNGLAKYDIDAADTGGSQLDSIHVKVSTMPGGVGPDLTAFTDAVTGIAANLYTTDFALPSSGFNAMLDGVTNYVTLRVLDGAATPRSRSTPSSSSRIRRRRASRGLCWALAPSRAFRARSTISTRSIRRAAWSSSNTARARIPAWPTRRSCPGPMSRPWSRGRLNT